MASSPVGWADALNEGVVLVSGSTVRWLNRRAAELLDVDRERAPGSPLIAVLRDHRLERVALVGGAPVEVITGGRTLAARAIADGLLLTDVSEIRRARESARALLAVLSHELRTPATTIRSALEALHFDLGDEQRARFLAHAEDECDRLGRLIEDLTVDSAPPRQRRLELPSLVERAARILASRLQEREVRLRSEVPALLVWADEDKLLQVLLNLLENAAVHGPANSEVVVQARLDNEAEPARLLVRQEDGLGQGGARNSVMNGVMNGVMNSGATVVVRVVDRGRPLAEGAFCELFEPHARGRRTGNRDGSDTNGSGGTASGRGSGMGLYIVRSIVERWGGTAWGRPLADGNEFGFTVPSSST
ncbi:MAG: ATP-binding protein [Trueperaceae bacterium]